VNGKKYCLRERNRMDEASGLLAKVEMRCKDLISFLKKKYPDKEEVTRLVKGFSNTIIQETLPTSTLTAYSENKGDKNSLFLVKEKGKTKIIEIGTFNFLMIQEVAPFKT